jgi:hypothetical protein
MTTKIEWGPVYWAEQLVPHSVNASVLSVAGDPSIGMVYPATFASRTSDAGGIALIGISYQDLRTPGGGAWAGYFEAWTAEDADWSNTNFSNEHAIINKRRSCADITPYRMGGDGGVVGGLHLGGGKPGANGQEFSCFGSCANVEALPTSVGRKGWVFGYNAIKMVAHLGRKFGEILAMAKGHGFRWYDPTGQQSSSIIGNVDNATYAPHIEFTNGAIHFLNANGESQFSFNTETGALYLGNGSVGPGGTIRVFVGGRPYLLTARPEQ